MKRNETIVKRGKWLMLGMCLKKHGLSENVHLAFFGLKYGLSEVKAWVLKTSTKWFSSLGGATLAIWELVA